MNYYGSDQFVAGAGFGLTVTGPTRSAPPTRELIPSTPNRTLQEAPFSLPRTFNDLQRKFGDRLIPAMLSDSAVASSFLKVKLGIVSGGLELIPTHKPPHYRRKGGEHQLDPSRVRETTPEEDRAREICEFNRRLLDRIDNLSHVLLEWLDGMLYGVQMVEPVFRKQQYGPDRGKLVWDRLKVKPSWSWRFVVDRNVNVVGILTWVPGGGFEVYDPDHFEWFTWLSRNNDPRGSCVLDAAYKPWNMKTQVTPMYYQHLSRWGSPGLDMELAESDTAMRMPVDINGVEVPGAAPLTPEAYHAQQLAAYANGSVLVHPAGSKVNVTEPAGDGEAFLKALAYMDQQIVWAIEMTTRAAAGGTSTKSESDSAEDNKGLVVTLGKMLLTIPIRSALRKANRINFGDEDAEQFTPYVLLPGIENRERAVLWNAVANLARAGYLGDSQKAELDALIGLPARDGEADAEADAAKMTPEVTTGQPAGPGQPQPNKPDAGKEPR